MKSRQSIAQAYRAGELTTAEAKAALREHDLPDIIIDNELFIWAGGSDLVEIDEDGTERYAHSGKTAAEVEERLKR